MKKKSREAIIGEGLNKGILQKRKVDKNRKIQIGLGIGKSIQKKVKK